MFTGKKIQGLMSVILVCCLIFSMFTGTAAISVSAEDAEITYWDGTRYSDLAATQEAMEGEGTEASPYIIKTAKQLYSSIYFGGGGAYYKLANDIYINEGYENYATWDATTKPARGWTNGTGRAVYNGTLDGAGYTVYGLYNQSTVTSSFAGLIPGSSCGTSTTAVIKNLNVKNSYVGGYRFIGIISGGSYTGGGSMTVENCTVSECKVNTLSDDTCAGGIIGVARNATVNNCAATDITFITGGNNTYRAGYASMGAIIGSSYISTNTGAWVASQANSTQITNSYSVNVKLTLSDGTEQLLYPSGIFSESAKASYCISAKNVYTDSTTIPTHATLPAIKVLISSTDDTSAAIDPTAENYPIKTITADAIKGKAAITAMPDLAWDISWKTVDGGYPVPGSGSLHEFWDGDKTTYEVTVTAEDGTTSIDKVASLTKAREAMAGEGTATDPEIITNGNQLYAVVAYGGQGYTYKLANDIYLNSDYQNYSSWTKSQSGLNTWIGGEYNDFHGTIDGDGHTIYGFYANTDTGSMVGFIPTINSSTSSNITGNMSGGADVVVLKNLHFKNAQVAAARWMGVMVGMYHTRASGSLTVTGCSVSDSKVIAREARPNAGGMVGLAGDNTTISNSAVYGVEFVSNSSSDATTGSGYAAYGAITAGCGWNYTTTADFNATQAANLVITNCVSVNNTMSGSKTGTVYPVGVANNRWTATQYSHTVSAKNVYTDAVVTDVPIAANNSEIKLLVTTPGGTEAIDPASDNYPIKNVSADAIKGEAAKTAMPKLNWQLYWSAVENDYPMPEDKSEGKVWDGTKLTDIESAGMAGSGTEADPYVITNGTQLYAAIFSGGNGYYYEIANDIILNEDYTDYKEWSSSAPTNKWTSSSSYDFIGHIDGNGYTIYGFYATGGNSGLIPSINKTNFADKVTIENINMSHSYIGSAAYYCGFIVGDIYWTGGRRVTINGCNVRNSKIYGIANNSRVGGIIGAISNSDTKISNCSVANVEFTASDEDTGLTGWDSMGSILGAVYTGPTSTGEINATGATRAQITNSFAVNCVRTNDGNKVYPVGIFAESETKYFVSVGAKNVYTDADVVNDVPTVTNTYDDGSTITFTLKVASVDDTSTAIDPTSADYPIKNITADGITGDNAKTAMADLNWCYFDTVSGDIPVWADNHTEAVLSAVAPTCTETGLTEGTQCSSCSEILVEQETVAATGHDFSGEWAEVDGGKQLTCLNCDEAKFMADITVDGAHLTSETEVFEVGTALGIEKLSEGTDYEAVMAAIPTEPKTANIYNITAALDGADVEPNGIATLSITVPEEWNSTDVVICLLTNDGKLRKMTTTLTEGVATAEINVMGVYALVDLSNPDFVGDVDCDGKVNSTDLTLLRKLLVGSITADEIAGSGDVNLSGSADLKDLVALKKYLVKYGY